MAAVVGDGAEAERLAGAYWVNRDVELAHAELVSHGDGVIRKPVVKSAGLDRLDEVIRTPGLEAIEVVAPVEDRAAAAAACLKAGLFTSVEAPPDLNQLGELKDLAKSYGVGLRIRLLPLYYPPYREMRRLVGEDAVGSPLSLKLVTRRGKGTELPEPLDRAAWIAQHELGFLSLAQWLLGPIDKVHARIGDVSTNSTPASSVIAWKYRTQHQYGYLQLDFCPGLHVRTFHEPVHRTVELTGIGGVILANRGEGQMYRTPALIVRGKSTTTAFEMIPDDWSEVHANLARETVAALRKGKRVAGHANVAMDALRLVEAARTSAEQGDEAPFV